MDIESVTIEIRAADGSSVTYVEQSVTYLERRQNTDLFETRSRNGSKRPEPRTGAEMLTTATAAARSWIKGRAAR